jgi:hypothetical protein
MIKNLLLLVLMVWVSFAHAKNKPHVVKESIGSAQGYALEKPVSEQEAQRSVAGEKIKKKKKSFGEEEKVDEAPIEDFESEVRYWQYSE